MLHEMRGEVVKVEVQMRDPYYFDRDRLIVPEGWLDWSEVKWHPEISFNADRSVPCDHDADEACINCLESWAIDWWLRFTDDTGFVLDLKAASGVIDVVPRKVSLKKAPRKSDNMVGFETCDRCGPTVKATIQIRFGDSELFFCKHHGHEVLDRYPAKQKTDWKMLVGNEWL